MYPIECDEHISNIVLPKLNIEKHLFINYIKI